MLKPPVFERNEVKKVYYFIKFQKIPFKDRFNYLNSSRIINIFSGLLMYTHSGKFWFTVRVKRWRSGLVFRFFKWPKKIAIYKKKSKKSKKSKGR